MNNPVYLQVHTISPTPVLEKISNLFYSHVYDFTGSFVCPKNVIAVFLTALEGSL